MVQKEELRPTYLQDRKQKMIVSPIVERAVTTAMECAGFSIKRGADKTIVWRRDLVGSYLQIHFSDHELYGAPHVKRWVLVYGDDPDVTVLVALDLKMFAALNIAKSIEAATESCLLPGAPRAHTGETASAG